MELDEKVENLHVLCGAHRPYSGTRNFHKCQGSSTNDFIIITFAHIKIMKDSTSVRNTGHFDNEIDFPGSGCSSPLQESRRKSGGGVFGIFSSPRFAGISGVPGWQVENPR